MLLRLNDLRKRPNLCVWQVPICDVGLFRWSRRLSIKCNSNNLPRDAKILTARNTSLGSAPVTIYRKNCKKVLNYRHKCKNLLYSTRDRLYGRMGSVSVRWRIWGHTSEPTATLRSLLHPLLEGVVGGGLWGLLSLTALMQHYLLDESSWRFLKYSLALSNYKFLWKICVP